MSTTPVSGDNRIDALLTTSQWGTTNGNSINLTYSFPTNGSTWKTNYGTNGELSGTLTYFNSTQKQHFRDAIQLWANVANINLTETDDLVSQGNIRATYSSVVSGSTAGWAYEPPSSATELPENGDLWMNPKLSDLSPGTQGYSTLIHELGHALGLKHPFTAEANNSAKLSGAEDSTQYSVMSYTDYDGVGNTYTQIGTSNSYKVVAVQPTTPMLYDILAMQYLYGANTSHATGNDTYTVSNSKAELKTIWDAGGIDTFDLSNQSLAQTINLNAGQFSSLGVKQTSISGPLETASENVGIAFDVVIENAIGGSGNDTIIGNSADNELTGGAGNDNINGGDGNDTAIYTGNFSDYTVTKNGSSVQVSSASEGTDSLSNIELLRFADQTIDANTLQATTPGATTPAKPTKPDEVVTKPTEGDSNHINYFLLQIGSALTTDASVSYTTRDGSAIAGQDYVATSGIATIKAGETSTLIAVEIIADDVAEADEDFLLAISNPQGASFPAGQNEIIASRTIIDDDAASSDQLSPIQIVGVEEMAGL